MARGQRSAEAPARRSAVYTRSSTRARPTPPGARRAPTSRTAPGRRSGSDRRPEDTRLGGVELAGDTGLGGTVRESSRPLDTRTDTTNTVLGPRGHTLQRVGILALVVVFLVVSISVPVRNHYQFVDQQRALAVERTQLEAEITELQQVRDRLNDPAYIEAQARQRFGAIKPGEVPYRVVNDDTAQRQAEQAAAAAEAARAPWNAVLWASIAGTP